jgi:hypothetical protein
MKSKLRTVLVKAAAQKRLATTDIDQRFSNYGPRHTSLLLKSSDVPQNEE